MTRSGSSSFTHLDEQGRAAMVDVTGKVPTVRHAVARCAVRSVADIGAVLSDADPDPLTAARVAGFQAAKRTAELVPLCHPIALDDLEVAIAIGDRRIDVAAWTRVVERTGVEMEALVACAAAGLSLVHMLHPADPQASIHELTLWHKSGGRSGSWQRTEDGMDGTGGTGGTDGVAGTNGTNGTNGIAGTDGAARPPGGR